MKRMLQTLMIVFLFALVFSGLTSFAGDDETKLPEKVAEKSAENNDAVILYLNDIPLLREDLEGDIRYQLKFRKAPKAVTVLDVFEIRMMNLVIRSAMSARYDELMEKAEAALKRIEAGERFSDVCKEVSDDRGSKEKGGAFGKPLSRETMVMPFERYVFEMKAGEVSKPFMTYNGIHIVKVDAYIKGKTPAEDKVSARHILFMFDAANPDNVFQAASQARASVKIKLIDQAYADYIYIPEEQNADK